MHAVLEDVAASRTGQSFASDILGAAARPATSATWSPRCSPTCATGGNVNAASRDLHIHRNTMLYKLDRASRLLGMDLRQADNQFAVWLAHTLDLLRNTGAEVDRVISPALTGAAARRGPSRGRGSSAPGRRRRPGRSRRTATPGRRARRPPRRRCRSPRRRTASC